ncbi:hypothetical protein [Piscirickettsia salmonis]|nr:hypothetical protein [Piscirickettsia salmonis]QHS26682.1 hypothetical protein GW538_13190 [Piscirickettsia salmonis]QHS29880.1 hypothetical protein GW537_13340 [Piscirickettsia salmonis]
MLGDFASLDVQNTYRGSDAYERVHIHTDKLSSSPFDLEGRDDLSALK